MQAIARFRTDSVMQISSARYRGAGMKRYNTNTAKAMTAANLAIGIELLRVIQRSSSNKPQAEQKHSPR